MRILVCVKQVNGELNPFDASALECALRVPGGEITVVSMGCPNVAEMLKGLTRLSAIRAVLLTDPAFTGSDTLATAYVLSLAARKPNPDLIVCGRQSVDGDTAQVSPSLAAMLGWPVITNVMELRHAAESVDCRTWLGEETAPLPALITVERSYTLRFPRLRSKTGEVAIWSAADLGAGPQKCGLQGSPIRILRTYECTSGKRKCRFITPKELPQVIDAALKKPRIPIDLPPAEKSCPRFGYGSEPLPFARRIAESIRVIERQAPSKTAEFARREKPAVILWDSGLWGRRNAPQAAALPHHLAVADKSGYRTAASRMLVDRGLLPYEAQVGLTGRTVNPAVCIACGISGAVQHTCAIEQAGTIIAINTDKAPAFLIMQIIALWGTARKYSNNQN